MERIEELKKDVSELESYLKQATRQKVKDILTIEIRKLVSEVVKLEEQLKTQNLQNVAGSTFVATVPSKKYEVKINNYAWDQSDKFIKFYITLKNVQSLPAENVSCEFGPKNVNLLVKNLDNKDYAWQIKNLLKEIDPKRSSWKIKSDMVLINAAKMSEDHWSHVTEWEKKVSDSKTPKMDSDKMDPSESLMTLMKNMYETGDDEMKRTIAKAWTENQHKNPGGFM